MDTEQQSSIPKHRSRRRQWVIVGLVVLLILTVGLMELTSALERGPKSAVFMQTAVAATATSFALTSSSSNSAQWQWLPYLPATSDEPEPSSWVLLAGLAGIVIIPLLALVAVILFERRRGQRASASDGD